MNQHSLFSQWLGHPRKEFFAGLVSSVAILPEVIGFAIIAHVNPMAALFASAVFLLVTTFLGGRPAMVSAAAGSMALVLAGLVAQHGISYMLAATILAGLFQLMLALAGIHRATKLINSTVMAAFVNALAILIFSAQVKQLAGQNFATYVMVLLSSVLMFLLPRWISFLPPALLVILSMTVVRFLFPASFQTVGDLGDLQQFVPHLGFPTVPHTWQAFWIILPYAVGLAFVGLIESLLTIPIVDQMTHSTGQPKREAFAQGWANLITGLCGGQAGCAMIGQAVINVQSGGRKRLSTLVSALALLGFLFFFTKAVLEIPTAALIGIMIVVAYHTFDWSSLTVFRKKDYRAMSILLVTVGLIVWTENLAIGVVVGVVLSLLLQKNPQNKKPSN